MGYEALSGSEVESGGNQAGAKEQAKEEDGDGCVQCALFGRTSASCGRHAEQKMA